MTKRAGKTVLALARSKAAAKRAADRAELTPLQQLARLDERPGDAAKERERLNAALSRVEASTRAGKGVYAPPRASQPVRKRPRRRATRRQNAL